MSGTTWKGPYSIGWFGVGTFQTYIQKGYDVSLVRSLVTAAVLGILLELLLYYIFVDIINITTLRAGLRSSTPSARQLRRHRSSLLAGCPHLLGRGALLRQRCYRNCCIRDGLL